MPRGGAGPPVVQKNRRFAEDAAVQCGTLTSAERGRQGGVQRALAPEKRMSILEEKDETLSAVDFQAIMGFLLAFVDKENMRALRLFRN